MVFPDQPAPESHLSQLPVFRHQKECRCLETACFIKRHLHLHLPLPRQIKQNKQHHSSPPAATGTNHPSTTSTPQSSPCTPLFSSPLSSPYSPPPPQLRSSVTKSITAFPSTSSPTSPVSPTPNPQHPSRLTSSESQPVAPLQQSDSTASRSTSTSTKLNAVSSPTLPAWCPWQTVQSKEHDRIEYRQGGTYWIDLLLCCDGQGGGGLLSLRWLSRVGRR